MPITSFQFITSLSLLSGVFAVQFIEEIAAPDLDQGKTPNPFVLSEAWAVAGPPYPGQR